MNEFVNGFATQLSGIDLDEEIDAHAIFAGRAMIACAGVLILFDLIELS